MIVWRIPTSMICIMLNLATTSYTMGSAQQCVTAHCVAVRQTVNIITAPHLTIVWWVSPCLWRKCNISRAKPVLHISSITSLSMAPTSLLCTRYAILYLIPSSPLPPPSPLPLPFLSPLPSVTLTDCSLTSLISLPLPHSQYNEERGSRHPRHHCKQEGHL